MRAFPVLPLLLALGAIAGSLGLGLWNRTGAAGPGMVLDLDREAYLTGGVDPGDLRSITLHQDTRRGLLDERTLQSLGFRRRHHGTPLPRPAFVVVERDTLLTVIAVGADAGALERQYSDRTRFLIVRALIQAYYYETSDRADGQVRRLLPSRLFLPPGTAPDAPLRLHSGRLHYPFVTD
jgi:hypothetical protein